MTEIWNWVNEVWSQNQFAQGGFLVMISGTLIGLVWKAWFILKRLVIKRCTVSIKVNERRGGTFKHIQKWLTVHCQNMKYCSNYLATVKGLMPSYGTHLFWYKGTPAWLYYGIEGDKNQRTEEISITFVKIFGKKAFVEKLLQEGKSLCEEEEYRGPKIYVNGGSNWTFIGRRENVSPPILNREGQYQGIVSKVKKFHDSENIYNKRCINYKYGILLYGPPGNGKTSTILSLANDLEKDIYMVNLSNMTESSLVGLMSGLNTNALVCFEDVDAMKNREDTELDENQMISESKLSLSTLLNLLDGMYTPNGLTFIMTTNYVDQLDPALVRKGRVDLKIETENANEYQIKELASRFDIIPNGEVTELCHQPMANVSHYFRNKKQII